MLDDFPPRARERWRQGWRLGGRLGGRRTVHLGAWGFVVIFFGFCGDYVVPRPQGSTRGSRGFLEDRFSSLVHSRPC